jgi:hypothetical protein
MLLRFLNITVVLDPELYKTIQLIFTIPSVYIIYLNYNLKLVCMLLSLMNIKTSEAVIYLFMIITHFPV